MIWSSSIGSRTPPLIVLGGAFSNVADPPPAFYRRISGREDRMIVFCDHRDSGRSFVCNSTYTIGDMAEDAMDVMRQHPRFGVIGISMGGIVAQHMAASFPERIDSLTLLMSTCNPRRATMTASIDREQTYIFRDQPIRGLLARWRTHNEHLSRDTRNARMQRMLMHGYNHRAHHGHAIMNYEGVDTQKIRCPTMIVHGRCDKLFPVEHAHELHSQLAWSHLRILEGVGHDINDDNLDVWLDPIMRAIAT